MKTKLLLAVGCACVLAVGTAAQKKVKAWTEWTAKDAQKILDDSPWGQTQSVQDTSEMFYKPTTAQATTTVTGSSRGGPPPAGGNNRAENGAVNQATGVRYRIRWLSSRPIRQALARQIMLKGGQFNEQLRGFAENQESRVVVGVWYEFDDQRYGGPVMQAFNSATTETLKNTAYLERKDGKRIFVQAYVPAQQNPFGAAIFIFPRTLDGQPLLTPDMGDVRFVAEFNRDLKLNMKYKVADMIYEGQLEY
jgi:hypothetical protein